MVSLDESTSASAELTVSFGRHDLARFLSTRSYTSGHVVKVTTSRWAVDVVKGREFTSLRAAFDDMRKTIRELPWADAGILLKQILDDKDRSWHIRTYSNGGLYVMAFPPEDHKASEHI